LDIQNIIYYGTSKTATPRTISKGFETRMGTLSPQPRNRVALNSLPMLLRSKPINYYEELEDDVKGDLKLLNVAMEVRSSKKEDILIASINITMA